jgi:NhaA family Na+:H+ antiporter
VERSLTTTFQRFVDSEKTSGFVLMACTVFSLLIANSPSGADYARWWQTPVGGLSIEHWINDALMAVFFLLIGLELERELYVGELSNLKNALLPIFAALGGMIAPALIHLSLNAGTPTNVGIGIPMATDIAFGLAVVSLLGNRVPAALKIFVVAFAVIDDLGAIIIIAVFYTPQVSIGYLCAALAVWSLLCALNRFVRLMSLAPYLLGGALMWFFLLKSGVHATIAGVLLAFAIPFTAKDNGGESPSQRLEHFLQKPVAFLVLPLFALANTAVLIKGDWLHNLVSPNSLGIMLGLIVGKPLGVTLFSLVAVRCGISQLPPDLGWRHVFGAGILGGVGFTMSIFIANLAFTGNHEAIDASKVAILLASTTAGSTGMLWFLTVRKSDWTATTS